MVIFNIILFTLLPFINYFTFPQKKYNSVIFLGVFYLIFNFLNVLFVGFLNLKYNLTQPIYYAFFFIWLAAFIFCIAYFVFKNKEQILTIKNLKNALYQYLPVFLGSIICIIVSLFVNSYFPDTQAYLSASYDFQNGLEPTFHNDQGPISIYYKVMPQMVVYASLYGNMLPLGYYLFNPFVICLIYISLTNEWINKKTNSINWNLKYLFTCVILIIIGLVCPFLSTFLTSGNIFNQSIILLISFSVIFYNKETAWTAFLPLAILQFLSPTGYINGFMVSIALLIFIAIYNNFKNVYLYLMFVPCLFSLPTFLFSNIFPGFRQAVFALIFVWLIVFGICYLIFKKKIAKIDNKCNLLIQHNWYQWLTYLLILVCAVLVPLVFYKLYPKSSYYTSQLAFLTMGLYILMFIYCVIRHYKYKKETNFHVFFSLMSIFSLIFIAFAIGTQKDNFSTWRIIYLNFGMGGPIDIVLLVYILLIYMFDDYQLKPIRLEKIQISKIWIFSFLLLFILGGFSIYNASDKNIRLFSTSPNVVQNLYKITNKDKQELLKYNNPQADIFLDAQVNYLLDKANIDSDKFFNYFLMNGSYKHGVTNWTISAYSLSGVINLFDPNLINENELIYQRLNQMLNTNLINTLILDQNTSYYSYVYENIANQFNHVYVGNAITILSKV